MKDYKKQGKKNREAGGRFENKVRADLERQGWIVCKWGNTVEGGKIVPAKRRYNPFMKALSIGTGFPDFIVHRLVNIGDTGITSYEVWGVEAKSNGYVKPEQRKICEWILHNKIFSKILIAKKGKKPGEIVYGEFTQKG